MKVFFLLMLGVLSYSVQLQGACGDIIYVNSNARGLKNGTSWEDAYEILEEALNDAYHCGANQEIWVAGGFYVPTKDIHGDSSDDAPQNRTFYIKDNIRLYGGFAGYETNIHQRIKYMFPTVLNGDLLGDDEFPSSGGGPLINTSDNSYNVMRMKNLNDSTIVDGFYFNSGNAAHSSTFSKQTGGAIFNDGRGNNNESTPIISNCSFYFCNSINGGGAIFNYGVGCNASPTFLNCEFKYNTSSMGGGAVYLLGDQVSAIVATSFVNCFFESNTSDVEGGAVYIQLNNQASNNVTFDGCTIVGNHAIRGGGIMIRDSEVEGSTDIINTVFHLNTNGGNISNPDFASNDGKYNVSYSHFSRANGTNFNSSGDPKFISSFNFRLQSDSPLIGKGKPQAPPTIGANSTINLDLDDNARVMGGRQDIGVYEFLSCPSSNIIYVNDAQTENSPSGESLEFGIRSLNAGLVMACHCPEKPTVYVSEGTYIPQRFFDMSLGNFASPYNNSFRIRCPMNLYGGQPSSPIVAPTGKSILDGDLMQNDQGGTLATKSENIRTIMKIDDSGTGSIIQGFSFENGYQSPSNFGNQSTALEIRNVNFDFFSLNVSDCDFRRNYSGNKGTVSINSVDGTSKVSFRKCGFIANSGVSGTAINYSGATNSNCHLVLENCDMLANTTLMSNNGQMGGTVVYKSMSENEERLEISNCYFNENEGFKNGGAISVNLEESGDYFVDINECNFNDNMAFENGGAIYVESQLPQNIYLRNSFFINNSAENGGACYFASDQPAQIQIENSIFYNNRSDSDSGGTDGGGAIKSLVNIGLKVINSTFLGNTAQSKGGAILSLGKTINSNIYNSLFWESTGSSDAAQSIINLGQSTLHLDHCLIEEPDCAISGVTCSNSIFDTDPKLDFSSGIRRFTPIGDSPAIDAGDNAATNEAYDYVGSRYDPNVGPNYRIRNNVVDIGAMENQGSCTENLILSPLDIQFIEDEIHGAWSARSSITIQPGFKTTNSNGLILDAPNVKFLSDYEFLSNASLEISTIGCNSGL